jgi:outer membrane protein assembly factor BamD (BamD/ComL family)
MRRPTILPAHPAHPARPTLLALAATLALAGCASKTIKGDDEPTLASLATRSVEVAPDAGIVPDEARAIAAYRSFLDVAKNAPQRPDAMRRLGDLEMELADRKSAERGATPDYKTAIAQYEAVLQQHPKAAGNDRVLYQLSRAQEQVGDLDTALKTLTRLVTEYPDTAHRDEAQFRRGELLFATRQYAAAGEAYATVLASGSAGPFTERALYMRGWSLFKQARLEEALHPFFGVLDLKLARLAQAPVAGGLPGDDPLAYLSRAERELLEDTHRVMSISLANLQGAASIPPFVTSDLRRGYEHRVYEQLAELYLRQERVKDAADTLAAFARERPLSPHAPVLLSRVIEIHEKNGFATLALESKKDFVVRYGRESEFGRANPEGWAQAQPLVRTHLAELARHHHALAQQSKSKPAVQEAVRWYRESLVAFPGDGDAAQNHFLLAELLFEDGQLAEAATNYEKVAYDYAAHAKGADAGYSALLAYAGQLKAAGATERATLQHAGIESALRFAERYANDPRSGAVTTNAAEQLLALGEAERAATVARRALALTPGVAERRTAWTVIAVSSFDRGLMAESEQAYGEALALAPERSALANDLAERRAAAIYKQAEAARDAGKPRDAIGHFERVARLAPQAAVRAAAQYDVATVLLGLKDWPAAAAALEEFRRAHPGHPLQADVPAKLALAYGEQQRWSAAAGELERIAAGAGEPELRRSALWQAAELHSKATTESGAPRAAAIRAYERYVQAWPMPLEPAVEARWRLAQLTQAEGQSAKSLAWVKQVREADLKGGAARTERTRTLGSLAALQLTEPLLEQYRKVALVEPLARNLKTKKARMEDVLKAYAAASQDGGAEAVTAATFHTAALYQDFGKALVNSQRPKGLKKLELEQYNVMLEEQAFPFEEKAIELHEANARRTAQGIWDDWVKKSFAALAQIKPVRYGKLERSEEVIDAIR